MQQVTAGFQSPVGRRFWRFILAALTVVLLALPAVAQQAVSAQSGLVNYISGRADVNGTPVSRGSSGLLKQMEAGDIFTVDRGAAEILLTPGAFLRLSEGASVQMVDTRLSDTQLHLLNGEAMVEVADLYDDNSITVTMTGGEVRLLKKGVYYFDGDNSLLRVFDGKAEAQSGDNGVELKKGRFVQLSPAMKVAKFHTGDYKKTFLYTFSENRSKRLAAANQRALRSAGNSASSLRGPGWIYSPWIGGYSFLPRAGRLISPFGGYYYQNLSWLMLPAWGYSPYGLGGIGGFGMGGAVGQGSRWGGMSNPRAASTPSFSSGPVRSSVSAGAGVSAAAPAARGRSRGR